MNKTNKVSSEAHERAVRPGQECRGKYSSVWAAVEQIAPKIGCVLQASLDCVKCEEVNSGKRHGLPESDRDRVK
jgi:transposase